MTERALATIRQIAEIKTHTNADSLELAIVDGWQVVVKKGEFLAGDLVVFFEIDSVLPVREEFEFLRKCCYLNREWLEGGEGFRLKTIRLRKELSQGLVLAVADVMNAKLFTMNSAIGTDVTELLGVTKWDPPVAACLSGMARGNFPSFIQKTDQERVQNCWNRIKEKYSGLEWEASIKLDGTSCSIYHNNGTVGVCSRNLDLKLEGNDENTYIQMAVKHNLLEGLKALGYNIAIQGEVMGPGIQGNQEQLKEAELFVFDIFLIDDQRHATPAERNLILLQLATQQGIVLRQAPVIDCVTLDQFETIQDILKHAEGPSLNSPAREGVVYKAVAVVDGQVPSFKVISNEWLLLNDG